MTYQPRTAANQLPEPTTPDPRYMPQITQRLAEVFGAEWAYLNTADRHLIVRDCTEEGGVADFEEYRRNIGEGNLYDYARTMRVRFMKRTYAATAYATAQEQRKADRDEQRARNGRAK